MKKKKQDEEIVVEDFTQQPAVLDCLKKLHDTFNVNGNTNGREFIMSDVLDSEGHQYVNLVQKGGGVLGVALVGYTFILEEMGIRFIRLAGTSAGAINTALMTVTGAKPDENDPTIIKGDKKKPKSRSILEAICNLNFFDLVDGHPAARLIIKNFITNNDFSTIIKKWITGIIILLIALPALDFIFLGLQHQYAWVSYLTKICFVLTGFFIMLLVIVISYTLFLITRLKDAGFGINPGDFFYDWIKKQLLDNHVKTVTHLKNVAATPVDDLFLRKGAESPEGLNGLEGDVTFIASEIVSMNKIEFPKMCELFRKDINDLQPAGFVRASMAIPLFFESYFINDIPCSDNAVKQLWNEQVGETNPPNIARFVDGGVLSNFPMNIFYNPKVDVPRLPSFGIDLDDEKDPASVFDNPAAQEEDKSEVNNESNNPERWSLTGYIYRIFNTVRFYYDKDFLIKNMFYRKGIGAIPMKGYNWLNFFLSKEDKQAMFVLGAKAATEFLLQFDWKEYKTGRKNMQAELMKNQSSKN